MQPSRMALLAAIRLGVLALVGALAESWEQPFGCRSVEEAFNRCGTASAPQLGNFTLIKDPDS